MNDSASLSRPWPPSRPSGRALPSSTKARPRARSFRTPSGSGGRRSHRFRPALGPLRPLPHDVDGDGRRDLLVGDVSGLVRFYRNEGTNTTPRYAAAVNLQAGGADAKVPIY